MHAHILPTHWATRLLQMMSSEGDSPAVARPLPILKAVLPPEADGHVRMLLSEMRPGQYGHILSLCESCAVRHHLLELGFTTGTAVEFVRVAPLGDPLTIRLRGYQLSLRKREAEAVTVRVCPPGFDDTETADTSPHAE